MSHLWKNQQCGFRTGSTQTELYKHRRWLEAENFVLRKKRNCTICVAKTKALISFATTAKLICAFGFVYADSWFAHEVAQIMNHFYKLAKSYLDACPSHVMLGGSLHFIGHLPNICHDTSL